MSIQLILIYILYKWGGFSEREIKINDELKASYRRGIVKELYSRKMITEQQYKRLLMK